MKKIDTYISEKLVIDKNTKVIKMDEDVKTFIKMICSKNHAGGEEMKKWFKEENVTKINLIFPYESQYKSFKDEFNIKDDFFNAIKIYQNLNIFNEKCNHTGVQPYYTSRSYRGPKLFKLYHCKDNKNIIIESWSWWLGIEKLNK